jgi:hypothetical protein
LQWVFDILEEFLPIEFILPVRPWPPPDPPPDLDPLVSYYSHSIVMAALGGILYSLADRYPDPSEEIKDRPDQEDRELIQQGVSLAMERVFEAMRQSGDEIERLRRFEGGLGRESSA